MKKFRHFTILALVVMASSSCGNKGFSLGREKLTPIYRAVTVNQLKNEKPISFSYEIDDTQIDEYAKNTGKFPLFGKLFQAIAVVLANTSISNSGGHELELASVDVDLSSLSEIDFDLVQYISLDALKVSVRNANPRDSLSFINKLEIFIKLDNPVDGLPMDNEGNIKILYYDNSKNSLACNGHCIQLNIAKVNWKKLLQRNKIVHLQPKLIINSVPHSTMKLAGSIDFSVKFNLGF